MLPLAIDGGLAAILDSLVSLSMLNHSCVIFFAYKEYMLEHKSSFLHKLIEEFVVPSYI